jgi:hypothetical protein
LLTVSLLHVHLRSSFPPRYCGWLDWGRTSAFSCCFFFFFWPFYFYSLLALRATFPFPHRGGKPTEDSGRQRRCCLFCSLFFVGNYLLPSTDLTLAPARLRRESRMAGRSHVVSVPLPFMSASVSRAQSARAKSKKHTTECIPSSSPTPVLILRSVAYVRQSGRDAQFSTVCGRMYWSCARWWAIMRNWSLLQVAFGIGAMQQSTSLWRYRSPAPLHSSCRFFLAVSARAGQGTQNPMAPHHLSSSLTFAVLQSWNLNTFTS